MGVDKHTSTDNMDVSEENASSACSPPWLQPAAPEQEVSPAAPSRAALPAPQQVLGFVPFQRGHEPLHAEAPQKTLSRQ